MGSFKLDQRGNFMRKTVSFRGCFIFGLQSPNRQLDAFLQLERFLIARTNLLSVEELVAGEKKQLKRKQDLQWIEVKIVRQGKDMRSMYTLSTDTFNLCVASFSS